MNLHDEENKIQQEKTALWAVGRLDELCKAGEVFAVDENVKTIDFNKTEYIKEVSKPLYEKLKASGYKPNKPMLLEYLRMLNPLCLPEEQDHLADKLLGVVRDAPPQQGFPIEEVERTIQKLNEIPMLKLIQEVLIFQASADLCGEESKRIGELARLGLTLVMIEKMGPEKAKELGIPWGRIDQKEGGK